jgi:hypothetical protein
LAKINEKRFFHSVNLFYSKISMFFEKNIGWRNNNNGAQKLRWRRVDFFRTDLQLKRHLAAL